MNANRSFRFFGLLALALLVMALAPTFASAQAYNGTFTLPFQARWSGIVLPAGNYSFRIESLSPTGMIVVQRDGKNVGLVTVGSVSNYAYSGKSKLVAVPTGEAYRISVLRVHDLCVIEFLTPKNERKMPARGPELTYLVPISGSKT